MNLISSLCSLPAVAMSKRLFFCLICCFIAYQGKAQQAKLIIPSGHIYGVSDLFYSDNEKYIVTVSENVKIWEAATGKLLKDINLPKKPSEAYLFKNNKLLVIACEDSVRVWDIYQDRQVKAIAGNDFNVNEKMNALIVLNYNDYTGVSLNAKLYDAKTFAFKFQFDDPIAAISKTNQYITVNFGSVTLYDSELKKTFVNKEGNSAGISSDFKYVSIIKDKTIKIWNTSSNRLLHTMTVDSISNYSLKFVPENNLLVMQTTPREALKGGYTTQKDDSYIRGFDLTTLKETFKYPEQKGNIQQLNIYNGVITIASNDSTIRQWDTKTGKMIAQVKDPTGFSSKISVDSTNRFILVSSGKATAKVWDMQRKKVTVQLEESNSYISKLKFIGNQDLAFFSRDNDAWIWDVKKGQPKLTVPGKNERRTLYSSVNNDGNFLYLITRASSKTELVKGGGFVLDFKMKDCKLEVYDINKGIKLNEFPLSEDFWRYAPSPDGKKVIVSNRDSTFQQIDIFTGNKSNPIKLKSSLTDVQYLSNNEFVIIADSTFSLYDNSNKLITALKLKNKISSYNYDQQSGLAAFVLSNQNLIIHDFKAGKLLYEIPNFIKNINKAFDKEFTNIVFDQTRKYLAISGVLDNNVVIVDLKTGDMSKSVQLGNSAEISFNAKNNLIMIFANEVYEWSIEDTKKVDRSVYEGKNVDALHPANKYVLGSSGAEVNVFDRRYKETMYTISVLPGADYIIYDQDKRFDGTETARKRLYLTCGMEIIELEQVKDQLWVPGLAKRIMTTDDVNSLKISDIDLCGLSPQVEKLEQKGGYRFRITPQKGGLGETILYLNDIELRRYTAQQLLKTATGYELILSDADLQVYLKSGQDNKVNVKAYTAKNDISSRGVSVTNITKQASQERPNLYAVMIGVSDYKGKELDLQYAAKDATDMSKAVAMTARKLFNTDNKEHVFMYNLTTDSSRYLLPEKKSIQQTLAAIGQKAKPNDVLMIFFAGHGVTHGPLKQFYLLTADASSTTATGSPSSVGISTAELADWIQPSKIKAQKRILILDACNSGQAINELVQIGAGQQNYLAARSSDNAEQIKAIDKLNERSGLFILAASATDQRAYEMGKYNQGILTYALLRSIKEQPDILDQGKYLDVGRWFGTAEKAVTDLVRETGNRQQPQVVSTSNFNIGVVDNEVMAAIKLPREKAMFTTSSLINLEVGDDDLGLTQLVNKNLGLIAARGDEENITYTMSNNTKDAYMLTGVYTIKGNEIVMKINLKKGTEIKNRFEAKGDKNNLEKTVTDAIKIAADWIAKNK